MFEEYYETPKPRPQGGGQKVAPLAERFWSKVSKATPNGCWLWTGIATTRGYGQIAFKGKMRSAHRIAFELQQGVIPKNHCVCHACDIKLCMRGNHLFVGTIQDNNYDRLKKGHYFRGSQHPNAKLIESDVLAIRSDRKSGLSLNSIARKYLVSKGTINFILRKKTWRHV